MSRPRMLSPLPPAIGIDIGALALRAVLLHPSRRGVPVHVVSHGEVALPAGVVHAGGVRDHAALTAGIRQLLGTLALRTRRPFAVCALPEPQTFLTTAVVTREAGEDAAAAIRRTLPTLLPLPAGDAIVSWQALAERGETMTILLAAAPQALVGAYARAVTDAGAVPIAFVPEALALTRAALDGRAERTPFLLLDVGATRTGAIVADADTVRATLTVPFASDALTVEVAGALGIPPDAAERVKRQCGLLGKAECPPAAVPVLARARATFADGIQQLLRYVAQHHPTAAPTEVLLTGGGSRLQGVDLVVRDATELPVRHLECPSARALPADRQPSMTTAVGLALLGLDPIPLVFSTTAVT